ncbi:MAG: VTT domain-containing protein [Anaerolineaceae bacterium]
MLKTENRSTLMRVGTLVLVLALTTLLFIFRNKISHLGVYGYPGIFVISILANATIIIPLPGVAITSAMGAVFNPFWVAVAAGLGAGIGETSGYLAGMSSRETIQKSERMRRITGWMEKYGGLTILVLAFIPNPAFDLAGIAAGALKIPFYQFLTWTCVGKILKMLMFAYGGAALTYWFTV